MIRCARSKDVARLKEIEDACFDGDRLSRASLARLVKGAHAETFVIEEGGVIYGYASVLFSQRTTVARLYTYAVLPCARRKGYGRRMIKEFERIAHKHKRPTLQMEVRADNAASNKLVLACNFQPFRTVKGYYEDGQAAIGYRKSLFIK